MDVGVGKFWGCCGDHLLEALPSAAAAGGLARALPAAAAAGRAAPASTFRLVKLEQLQQQRRQLQQLQQQLQQQMSNSGKPPEGIATGEGKKKRRKTGTTGTTPRTGA